MICSSQQMTDTGIGNWHADHPWAPGAEAVLKALWLGPQDCGLPQHLIRTTIDGGTAPARFSHLFPAIGERDGNRSSVTHRQRAYAQITDGRYTLFDPATEGQLRPDQQEQA